ncbi:hypothetical protein [Rouxiella sp. WC2420]|uniref:Phage head morphogenesis domain-containing protein n=1 Tax=Rouxiella sp. WC2420 TaxID=3234145 RepID=A0AB39VL10_9GAMM
MVRQDLLQAVVTLTGLTLEASEKITDDLIAFNPKSKNTKLTKMDEFFNSADNRGFNAYAFHKNLQDYYRIDKKQASIIANSFRARAASIRSLLIAKSANASLCQWTFRSTCISVNRTAHQAVNGRQFEISEGIIFDYGKSFPGIEFGCNCDMTMIIPELTKENKPLISRMFDKFFGKK